jgi:protein TonB
MEIEEIEEAVEEVIEDVPFAVIENVPVYPGCETAGNNAAKKKCMSEKIQKFVQKKFNTELANDLGLEGRQRISVQFKIDNKGNVVDVRARAPHPKLESEAVNVVKSLPKMTPGMQRGKAVGVIYALPILFQVEN